MYEKNILHRDIKPSNILIKDNNIKIADFGTSKQKQEN
jgi:serine/threonine protein kinase